MNEQNRKKIVNVALVFAIIYGVYTFWPSNSPVGENEKFKTIKPIAGTNQIQPSGDNFIDVDSLANIPWGADPFRSKTATPTMTKTSNINWVLTGIIFNEANPMAIINKKTVGIGDIIDRATVIAINRKDVTLEHKGKMHTLAVTKG